MKSAGDHACFVAAANRFCQRMEIVGRSVDEIHLADAKHQIDLGIRRQRAADMKRGGTGDAQTLPRTPSTSGETTCGHAVDGHVARPQPRQKPGQCVEIALHVNVAVGPAVDFLPLPRSPAGHIDQSDLFARDAETFAERRVLGLVGQKIRLV